MKAALKAWKEIAAVRLARYRLADVAPIFNLILLGSEQGHFCNLYPRPRYMAGLAIQLFTLLAGWLRLPEDGWFRCTVHVLEHRGHFAGFAILRHGAYGPKGSELYMFAVAPEFQRHGLGSTALRTIQAQLPIGHRLFAHCLPKSRGMLALLLKLGFTHQPAPRQPKVRNFVHRLAYTP